MEEERGPDRGARLDSTMTLFILFLVPGWHLRQLPLHDTAASAIIRPERDYLLRLQTMNQTIAISQYTTETIQ